LFPTIDRRLDPDRGAVDRVAREHRPDIDALELEVRGRARRQGR